jgi:hypothetical protein
MKEKKIRIKEEGERKTKTYKKNRKKTGEGKEEVNCRNKKLEP